GEVILSYATTDGVPSTMQRRAAGWINDLSRKQLESLLTTTVPHFQHVGAWETQEIYRLSSQLLVPLPDDARLGPRRRVTLCGSFGFGNAGDEGAWMATEDLAHALGFEVAFDLVTRFPKPFMKRVIGTGPEEHARRQRLRDQKVVFVGGGVIDASQFCVLLANEPFLRETSARSFGLLGVNVETGKRYDPVVTAGLRALLSEANQVTVRDQLSAETLRAIAPEVKSQVVGDVVLWLTPTKLGLPAEVAALPRYVAVNAPRWKDDRAWRAWITDELIKVSRALDAPLVFVPCSTHFDDDRPAHSELASDIRRRDPGVTVVEVKQHLDPRQTAGLFAGAVLTVGMRLHACVMSYGNRVPCVGLAYHSKLHGFFRTVGAEAFLLPGGLPTAPHEVSSGFSFADSGLGGSDLASAAREAIARFPFDRLAALKDASAEAFRRIVA
ncbi:MAG TPA: polysaccharide pyruvyl transferase family protein, partial [Acidothermaceae bacterium]